MRRTLVIVRRLGTNRNIHWPGMGGRVKILWVVTMPKYLTQN